MEKPSFIITGASASGKSTLIDEALDAGYHYLPTHMTRDMRENERDGIDGVFISRDQFEQNFSDGQYLEPSLEYAELRSISAYYGTPLSWVEALKEPESCASPVAIKMAKKILEMADVEWFHLVCSDFDRFNRLRKRGYSDAEVYARMTSGESIIAPNEATIVDSSSLSPKEILRNIRRAK